MQIEVFARLDELPRKLQERVEERAASCLTRHAERLLRLRVVLREEPGGRGEVGCRLVLECERGNTLVANATGRDVDAAVGLALLRVRERLRRRDRRRQDRHRGAPMRWQRAA